MTTIQSEGAFDATVRGQINANFALTPEISSGTATPSSTPKKVGDIYVKTDTAKIYVATGTASSSDWTIVN
jgi:hypothetical protein